MAKITTYVFEEEKKDGYGFGIRHVQTLLVCCFMMISFITRVKISVAVVAMTDKTQNSTTIEIFDWDKQTQDVILSSFFWGYTLMQIPMGILAEKFGTKPLYSTSLIANGLISLTMPFVVHWGGWKAMCVCRTLQGVTQSCAFPGAMVMGSRWIPKPEKSRLSTVMFSGITLGTVVGLLLSSFLSATSHGWPIIFYIVGGISLTFSGIWIAFSASSPKMHRSISEKERQYISENTGFSQSSKKKKIPWKHILTSMPVYAILVAQTGTIWAGNTVALEMPSYMNKILKINIKNSGIYSSLPYMTKWILSVIASVLSDWIVNNKYCSAINSRRIFNTCGTWLPAILFIIMTYLPRENPHIVIGFYIFTAMFLATINVGFMLTYMDIAPNYSGTILGMTNFISQGIGIFAPLVVGFVVTDEFDASQWQTVFFITSGVLFFCNLFYLIFTSAEKQPWNDDEAKELKQQGEESNARSPNSAEAIRILEQAN